MIQTTTGGATGGAKEDIMNKQLYDALEQLTDTVSLVLFEISSNDTGWYYKLQQHMQEARTILNNERNKYE